MTSEMHYEPPQLDGRELPKRVGLIALATDATIEGDFRRFVARDNIAVHVNRIRFINPTTPENLRAMHPDLAEAASLILPGEKLDAIVYGCTSASVVIGEEAVRRSIVEGRGDSHVITPAGAASDALSALRAKRIAVLTPYVRETAEPLSAYFQARGYDVTRAVHLNMEDDRHMARIPVAEIVRLVGSVAEPGLDAIFVGCTAFPAAEAAAAIEEQTGIPVVTSNLATAWSVLRHCGYPPDPAAAERLLRMAEVR